MTPETIEPLLAAISGGAVTIAREMSLRAGLGAAILIVFAAAACWFADKTESEDLELALILVMLACGVFSILLVIRAVFVLLTPHLSAISYLSGVLK